MATSCIYIWDCYGIILKYSKRGLDYDAFYYSKSFVADCGFCGGNVDRANAKKGSLF